MKRILILGATSSIAVSCARLWAAEQAKFFLVGRDEVKLNQIADDLRARGGVSANYYQLDFNSFSDYPAMLAAALADLTEIDTVLIAQGTLPDQTACENSVELTLQEFSINALSVIALLTPISNILIGQGYGTIAVLSSVAGDRGRSSNYVYGAAKSAVTTFCEGLRSRLFHHNVRLLTIKPGFVDTPMTQHLKLPGLLVAKPDKIASDIIRAINRKKDLIYSPFYWQWIMLIIKSIPNVLFKRLKI